MAYLLFFEAWMVDFRLFKCIEKNSQYTLATLQACGEEWNTPERDKYLLGDKRQGELGCY